MNKSVLMEVALLRHPLLDVAWVVLSAILVFVMQAGFMCLEAGLVRQKNSINVAIKNFTDFFVSSLAFFAIGFALMFGASKNGLIGTDGFFLNPYITTDAEGWIFPFWFFQDVFCGTASTIVAGGVAERIRYRGYIWVSFTVAAIAYPIFGHWAWGGGYDLAPEKGWLAAMGYLDFAGSSVVHMVGGTATLACLFVVGPRKGRYRPDGSTVRIWGSNIPLATLGAFLLWVGWFGFNGGSTLAMNRSVGMILVNTNLAACTGAVACLAITWFYKGKPEVEGVLNGALGGLVAVTAPCAYISPLSALAVGALGGFAVYGGSALLERFHIDDAVDAIPVHLFSGVVGILSVGLFAKPEFLVSGSRAQQIGVQATGAVVCFAFVLAVEWLLISLFDRYVTRIRVDPDDENQGLNLSEHGARTLWHDLGEEMHQIEKSNDLTRRAAVEPETEEGAVAQMFNTLMATLEDRTRRLDEERRAVDVANLQISATNRRLIEKEQENETFVYSISHDLRSPLVSMMGFSREMGYSASELRGLVLQSALPEIEKASMLSVVSEGIEHPLHFIHGAVERMRRLTDGLVRLSRLGTVVYRMCEVDLSAVIQRLIQTSFPTQIQERNATVTCGALPTLIGDPTAIEQLFANLLGNALTYLDPTRHGQIEIGCAPALPEPSSEETVFHRLFVKDNGLGIPAHSHAKIFQVFQRFHPNVASGIGLGLSIVKKIVDRHGGKIDVESTEGVGSAFWILWPKQPMDEVTAAPTPVGVNG